MTTEFLYNFISKHRYAVLSTVSADGHPEASLVGFAVTPDLKLIFDTVTSSRKYKNLIKNSSIALVIGWEGEQTIQYEGRAEIPTPRNLNELLATYFNAFPDGKERKESWKDITYFMVVPTWIRYSDYNIPQVIEEVSYIGN
jgi:general stress protein 26